MISSLIRKDIGLVKPVLVVQVVLFLLPMAIAFVVHFLTRSSSGNSFAYAAMDAFPNLLIWSLLLSFLASSSIGGVLMARERRERSVEHIGLLPVSRRAILASKMCVATVASLFAVSIVVVLCLLWIAVGPKSVWIGVHPASMDHFNMMINQWVRQDLLWLALVSLSLMGFGWLFGSVLRSDTYASLLGAALPILMVFATMYAMERLSARVRLPIEPQEVFRIMIVGSAVVPLAIGSIIMLKRRTL